MHVLDGRMVDGDGLGRYDHVRRWSSVKVGSEVGQVVIAT